MYFRLIIFCVSLIAPVSSWAMEFSIERLDLRPIRPPTLHITATGEIQTGDTEKLKNTIEGADVSDVRDVLFMFDSPGGSLMESLRMGDYIADIPAIVSAQVGASDMPDAICASACVYAYIAADYRYISNDARIGVHRFGFTETDLDGNEGAAIGQAVSGILSEYIRSHRVEPDLFETVSLIDHNDILWVSRIDLEKWRVVTNGIYDEQASYINLNGKVALRMKQVAITGDSFLTLFCTKTGVAGVADLHEPELAAYGTFDLGIDDAWYPGDRWEVIDRSDMRGKVLFDMPSSIAQAAMRAEKFGARIVSSGGDLFFGFQQIIRDGLLNELIRSCPMQNQIAVRPMIDQHATDYPGADLTTDGIRDVSFAQCKAICMKSEQCNAVSYVQNRSWCWPKSGVERQRPTAGVISAFKR
ncbi:PAN domain-containing protein [Pseudophaeobacter leonis]|uniref:PAN domain-containing protein n=1 Tax=Pseudophaeobacter leonis TaxID=1144477 RepID=UPI00111C759C|nr:PAN domain-containing protein [Pseudophaeobacter leonis]